MSKPFTIAPVSGSDAWRVLRNGETFITTHATDSAPLIASMIADALNVQAGKDAALATRYASTAMLSPEVEGLIEASIRALPLLVKLGDFIGNGPVDASNPSSLGERCDVIGALRDALTAVGVSESELAPTATAPRKPGTVSAVVMYRDASGADGDSEVVEGTLSEICAACASKLGAHNASIVWATNARTGKLITGMTHDGGRVTTIPTTSHGFFDTQLRTIYPPHARIMERGIKHTYRTLRGFTATVLVYTDGWCIGFADPRDLGYADTNAMIAAGVAS